MVWFNDLLDVAEELLDDTVKFLSGEEGLPPFGASVRASEDPEEIIPGGPDDPVGQQLLEVFEAVTGIETRTASRIRIRRAVQENRSEMADRLSATLSLSDFRDSEIVDLIEDQTMPVDYSDWISIAFEVAKQKGATFDTSQAEIEAGAAPTSIAIQIFAEVWNDRKDEISASRARAREIAEEEIEV